MIEIRKLLVMMLAVLWLPVTSHCLLEGIPGFEFLKCDSSAATNAGCCDDGDGCDVVESGFYQVADNGPAITPLIFAVESFFPAPVFRAPAALETEPVFLIAVSPAPSHTWQFSRRAALPPRAPSFAS